MNFIYPNFLWALSALLIPVLIHLFNFQRPKVLVFSNLRYLKQVQQQTRSVRQLKRYLVLLTRLVAIAALVLAFAQPIIKNNKSEKLGTGQPLVLLYIDNSHSMQAAANQGTLLDVAIASAERAVNQYPSQTRFNILTNDFSSQGSSFVTKKEAINQLREIKYSNNYREASAIGKRINAQFNNQNSTNRQCIIFSDFQKSTLGNIKNIRQDSISKYLLVPVFVANQPNLVIDSAYLETPLVLQGETNTLLVKIRNTGSEPANNIPLKIFLNNVQISTQQINVNNGTSVEAKINFQLTSDQITSGKIIIDDQPNTFDNDYYFTLKPSRPINVYSIFDKPSPQIQKIFANTKLFNFKESSISNLDYENLKAASFIIFNELNAIDPSIIEAINQGTKNKSILFIPPATYSSSNYSSIFSTLGIPAPELANQDTSRASNTIVIPQSNDLFFKGVFENNRERLISPEIFKVWNLSGSKILAYQSGKIAISQFKKGSSNFYLAAGSLTKGEKSLAKSALILPMLYKMAFYSAQDIEKIAYSFQENTISIPTQDSTQSETPLSLSNGQSTLIPQQQIRNNQYILSLPHTEARSGIYNLSQDKKLIDKLAFNYSKTESFLDNYSPADLKSELSIFSNIQIADAIKDANSGAEIYSQQSGYALWKYLVWLALAALLLEILFLRFIK